MDIEFNYTVIFNSMSLSHLLLYLAIDKDTKTYILKDFEEIWVGTENTYCAS